MKIFQQVQRSKYCLLLIAFPQPISWNNIVCAITNGRSEDKSAPAPSNEMSTDMNDEDKEEIISIEFHSSAKNTRP